MIEWATSHGEEAPRCHRIDFLHDANRALPYKPPGLSFRPRRPGRVADWTSRSQDTGLQTTGDRPPAFLADAQAARRFFGGIKVKPLCWGSVILRRTSKAEAGRRSRTRSAHSMRQRPRPQ